MLILKIYFKKYYFNILLNKKYFKKNYTRLAKDRVQILLSIKAPVTKHKENHF
jgi:hypothetical protein